MKNTAPSNCVILKSMWDYLKKTSKPILIYGRGNAAETITAELRKRGKEPAGFFSSDGFVREKTFLGYPVTSFREALTRFGPDCIVLLAFGTHREDVLQTVRQIASQTEFFAPDIPVAGEGLFDKAYYASHREQLQTAFEILADEQSRRVFRSVVSYKLSGIIDFLLECDTPPEENWSLLSPGPGKTYADLGAYTGDTVTEYLQALKSAAPGAGPRDLSVLAVEPEPRNFRKLQETISSLGFTDCRCVQAAAGDTVGKTSISKGAGRGSRSDKRVSVAAETLDHLLAGKPAHIVKMDVEGAETAAIRGAERTIRENCPAMLIAAYHRTDDLWSIPLQVLAIRSDYRVYLRRTRCLPAWEINYIFA